MAGRPEKNSARLRHALSTVYASDTRSGSREFQPSSAARALTAAVSRVNGGNGGRPCDGEFTSEVLGERHADGARRIGDGVRLQATQWHAVHRVGTRLVDGAFGGARDFGALVEHVLGEQFDAPAVVVDARGQIDDAVARLLAEQ